MGIIKRAWALQHCIEKRIALLPSLSLTTHLQFISLVLFLTGIGMFLYCIIANKNIFFVILLNNPLFYLCLGFTVFCFYLWEKFNPSNNRLK